MKRRQQPPVRRKPPARPQPPADELVALQQRYRELHLRHQELLDKLAGGLRAESAVHQLSWFALRSVSSALALFRNGFVALANPHWHELASARHPGTTGWTWLGSDGERAYPDLGTLGASELARLLHTGDPLTAHCKSANGQVLRVRLERLNVRGEGAVGLLMAEDETAAIAHATEMARMREAMGVRDRMSALGRMAAGVVHDLGNTVNALALRVALISRCVDESGKQHVSDLGKSIDLMRGTLDRLARFSGRRTQPTQAIDLRAVLVEAARLVDYERGAAKESRVTFDLDLPPKLPRVAGHEVDLIQVFVNLMLNAHDAMPDGGVVTVQARVDGPAMAVRVCDRGPGFAETDLPRIFEPFFTTKGALGTGLGLSLAYATMEAIGGSISARNRREGGAEITLHIPLAPASSVLGADRRIAVGRRRRQLKRLQ